MTSQSSWIVCLDVSDLKHAIWSSEVIIQLRFELASGLATVWPPVVRKASSETFRLPVRQCAQCPMCAASPCLFPSQIRGKSRDEMPVRDVDCPPLAPATRKTIAIGC